MYTITVTDLYSDDPSSRTTSYNIQKGSITIGRSRANDIVIRQTNISTKHASVTKKEDGFFLEDLNSTNGTLVNKKALHGEIRIFSDDQIELGGVLISISGHPDLDRSNAAYGGSDLPSAALRDSDKNPNLDDLIPMMDDDSSRFDPNYGSTPADDLSLSSLAPLPSGEGRPSISLDSILPDEGSRKSKSEPGGGRDSLFNPFPDDEENRLEESQINQPGQDYLLDKIKSLESKVIKDKGIPTGRPSSMGRDNRAQRIGHSKPPVSTPFDSFPTPPPRDAWPETNRNENIAGQPAAVPFPDLQDSRPLDESPHALRGKSIVVKIIDPNAGTEGEDTRQFSKQSILIGRNEDCDIRLTNSFISGMHAAIEYIDGTLQVRDLSSRNGTFVNGQKIEGTKVIDSSDTVSVGHIGIVAMIQGMSPRPSTAGRTGSPETLYDMKVSQPPVHASFPAFPEEGQSQAPSFPPARSFPSGTSFPPVTSVPPGVTANLYKENIEGNIAAISLQLGLARKTLGKALDRIQNSSLPTGKTRHICRPLAETVKTIYNIQVRTCAVAALQNIADSAIDNICLSLERAIGTPEYSATTKILTKAHSILFPLSTEGYEHLKRTGAAVGLSLLSELGFLGYQQHHFRVSKKSIQFDTVDLEGVLLAGIRLNADFSYLDYARTLSQSVADTFFLDPLESLRLVNVVDEACTNAIEHAFGLEPQAHFNLSFVTLDDNRLGIVVDDMGMPFDTEKAQTGQIDGPGFKLLRAFCDEVHFVNRGRRGKRIFMIFPLPQRHSETFFSINAPKKSSEGIVEDGKYRIVTLSPDQADTIPKCVFRAYKYEYYNNLLYDTETLKQLLANGQMLSAIALTDAGAAVGHMSVTRNTAASGVGQLEHTIIAPNLNSANMASKLTTHLIDYCRDKGLMGLTVNMIASHPYEQIVYGSLGAQNTGIMLGHLPAAKAILDDQGYNLWGKGRQSVATAFIKLAQGPKRKVYVPSTYADLIDAIYGQLTLKREIVQSPPKESGVLPAISNVAAKADDITKIVFISVLELGDDIADVLTSHFSKFKNENYACIYVDLKLSDPALSLAVQHLRQHRFFFSCIIPETEHGDVLRMQATYLGIDTQNIHIEKNFGKAILERIDAEYRSLR